MTDQEDGPDDIAMKDSRTRYRAVMLRTQWMVLDTWFGGGCFGYKDKTDAEKEAKRRNGPHLTVVGVDYRGDDECPF